MVPMAGKAEDCAAKSREDTRAVTKPISGKLLGHVEWPTHDRSEASVLLLPCLILGRKVNCLVDSGAEKSLLPHTLVPESIRHSSSIRLVSAGGDAIPTFGHSALKVEVPGLRRAFSVDFILTETKPILGIDFFVKYGLTINLKGKLIHDPLTHISSPLIPSHTSYNKILVNQAHTPHSFLSDHFPQLLSPPDYSMIPSDRDVCHTIETEGTPIHSRPRQLSTEKLAIAKQEFDALIALKVIRPSSSPWSSPLHMVKKKDGSWRPCGDYRRLNSVTVSDRYSLPNIQTIHHKLAGSQIFSRLDLVKAYHFIPVREEDIAKTAICTPFGTYEYLRMPFGLKNSASTFQRYVDNIFRSFSNVITYIDDILIYNSDKEQHEKDVKAVLNKLDEVGLKVNGSKSLLFQAEIDFLGYRLNSAGIKPMPDRVTCLSQLTPPTDAKQLQRYIGMFGFYQRCLPDYTTLMQPLRDLLRADTFTWSDHHTTAFDTLKKHLADATELAYPQANATLTLTCDASAHAIGACLHQVVNGKSTPLSFFSRTLSATEQRYSTFDRELLALFAAVKKWRDFISGYQTTAFTDHKPLVGAIKNPKPRTSDRQERQLAIIGEFVHDIVHVPGRENVVADALSRPQVNFISTDTLPATDLIAIAKSQSSTDIDKSLLTPFSLSDSLTIFCETSSPNPRPFVPSSLRKSLFTSLHTLSHPGWKATARIIGSRYYWQTLKQDVKSWCSECTRCQAAKVTRHTKPETAHLPCPTQRFTTVHIDIVGPLESEDHSRPRYLLTMIDAYTRWVEAFPLTDITAESVSKAFLYQWISRFGPPLHLVTDRGTQFNSEIMHYLNLFFSIHHIRTSAYHPQSNGMIERSHRILKASLRARGGDWLTQLPLVLLGMRMSPDESGNSAFSLVTGEQPLVPHILTDCLTSKQLAEQLRHVQFPLKLTRPRKSTCYTPKDLASCEYVWLRTDRVKKPLETPYQGPYKVLRREPHTFVIDISGKSVSVSIERLKPAKMSKQSDDKFEQRSQQTASTSHTPSPAPSPEPPKDVTTRSGRRVRFNPDNIYHYG